MLAQTYNHSFGIVVAAMPRVGRHSVAATLWIVAAQTALRRRFIAASLEASLQPHNGTPLHSCFIPMVLLPRVGRSLKLGVTL
jgi:hypothetical protein